jgi:heme exporter protein D
MPDLGKYADAILWSWAATLVLVAAVIAVSWWQSARVKKKLDAAEARRKRS